MELPFEILTLVFRYLPAKDLDAARLVCRSWRDVASDKIWKQQFVDRFGTDRICPVSPQFTAWRRELLLRSQILQKWNKCLKQTDLTVNSTLLDNTEIFCNFSSDLAQVVCFNSPGGSGNIIELDRGKIKRKLYASRYSRETLPVSAVDGSKYGMIYGFLDGTVTTVAFSNNYSVVSDYTDLPLRHDIAVTSVWIAKSRCFQKPANYAIGIATGGLDGTVSLISPHGHVELRPERSAVILLEGSLSGSYAANDGDSVVALYENGSLYRFDSTSGTLRMSLLARLPLKRGELDTYCQLHLCNNYAVLQSAEDIYIVDMTTNRLLLMEIPSKSKITAFSIDKSRTPGTKLIVAGLSSNRLCAWELPAIESTNTANRLGPRIGVVRPCSGDQHATGQAAKAVYPATPRINAVTMPNSEDRQVSTKPLWIIDNPIGHESRLAEANKPQITKLALNSVILLVAGYNGMVYAVDALSGSPLKRISSRISKNVLDLSQYSRDGFVPVTHLEIDPDPLRLRAVISVRPALQYLDLGNIGISKASLDKKKGPKPRFRNANTINRHDIEEDIELGDASALADAEREQRNLELAESFGLEGMEPDEQVAYAMMLSRQQEETSNVGESEQDDELRLALEVSANQAGDDDQFEQYDSESLAPATSGSSQTHGASDDDEMLQLAFSLSLGQS